jgi:hypothetical protein
MWSGDRLKMRIKVEAVIFAKNLRIGKSNKVNHWPKENSHVYSFFY